MPFCSNCGAKMEVNQKFCTGCGAKAEPLPDEAPEIAPEPAKVEVIPEPPATQVEAEAPSSTTVLAGQKFEEKKKEPVAPKDEFAEFNKEPTFTLEDADGRTFSTTKFPCVFGKGTAAGVQISGNNAISREHFSVTFENKKFYIEDLNSSNFTYVNGRQVDAKTKIQVTTGDELKLADELFTVEVVF